MNFLLLPELQDPKLIATINGLSIYQMSTATNEILVRFTSAYPNSRGHKYDMSFVGVPKGIAPSTYVGGYKFAGVDLEDFTRNCGARTITAPRVKLQDTSWNWVKKLYVEMLEAYCVYLNIGLIVGSDNTRGPHYELIKNHGTGWEFSKPTRNRNYPDEERDIGIYWKNVGDFAPTYEKWIALFKKAEASAS